MLRKWPGSASSEDILKTYTVSERMDVHPKRESPPHKRAVSHFPPSSWYIVLQKSELTTTKYTFRDSSEKFDIAAWMWGGSAAVGLAQHRPRISGGIWRRRNVQFSFPPSPRSTLLSTRTAATTLTPSQSSALVSTGKSMIMLKIREAIKYQ